MGLKSATLLDHFARVIPGGRPASFAEEPGSTMDSTVIAGMPDKPSAAKLHPPDPEVVNAR